MPAELDAPGRRRRRRANPGQLTVGENNENKERAELRRRSKQLEVENGILKRAAAYFARENVLPK